MIEITEKTVGIWFLTIADDQDWLCGVTEVEPEKEYKLAYRFRYHKDGKVFDSADEKSGATVTAKCSRAYVLAAVKRLANDMKTLGAIGELDELMMKSGDVDKFVNALMEKPWAFVRIEGKVEE